MRYLAPLIALLLCTVACSATGAGVPTARQEPILATPTINGASAQNETILMGENRVSATQEPTALPTTDPLIAQMAADVKAANERADAALKLVNDQNERIAADYAKAAADNLETARTNERTGKHDADKQRELTKKMALEIRAKEIEAQMVEAETQWIQANTANLYYLMILVLVYAICLVAVRWMWLHPHVAPAPKRTSEDSGLIALTQNSDDADLVPPGDIAQFALLMEYAADGGLMGFRDVIAAGYYGRGGWGGDKGVYHWLDKKHKRRAEYNPPMAPLWGVDSAGRRIFSDGAGGGKEWAEKWLQWYHNENQPTAPLNEDTQKEAPPPDTGVQNTGV